MKTTLEEIKKLTKSTHATSCTSNNCACGVDAIEWKLKKLFSQEQLSLLQRFEEVIGKDEKEDYMYFDDFDGKARFGNYSISATPIQLGKMRNKKKQEMRLALEKIKKELWNKEK